MNSSGTAFHCKVWVSWTWSTTRYFWIRTNLKTCLCSSTRSSLRSRTLLSMTSTTVRTPTHWHSPSTIRLWPTTRTTSQQAPPSSEIPNSATNVPTSPRRVSSWSPEASPRGTQWQHRRKSTYSSGSPHSRVTRTRSASSTPSWRSPPAATPRRQSPTASCFQAGTDSCRWSTGWPSRPSWRRWSCRTRAISPSPRWRTWSLLTCPSRPPLRRCACSPATPTTWL